RGHGAETEKQTERNHQCCDQSGAEIAKQQEQNYDHKRGAFEQIVAHSRDGAIHQRTAIVKWNSLHTCGQSPVYFVKSAGDILRYRSAVLAQKHEGGPQHCFLAVERRASRSQLPAEGNIGHVTDPDRHCIAHGDYQLTDVLNAGELSRRPYQPLLAVAFDVSRAGVGVVALQCGNDIFHGEMKRKQLYWFRGHLVLANVTADTVYFCDAGHFEKLRANDPVLDGA